MTLAPPVRRPRWLLTVVVWVVCWVVALGFAAGGLLAGSQFMADDAPAPSTSVVFWVLAGLLAAAPIAALPLLGHAVRRRGALITAAVVAVGVALLGLLVLNTP